MTDTAYLVQLGYSEAQAEGMLRDGLPRFVGDRLALFHDYCGAREMDPYEMTAVLHFLHDELTGALDDIGREVREAETADAAAAALAPYRGAFCCA